MAKDKTCPPGESFTLTPKGKLFLLLEGPRIRLVIQAEAETEQRSGTIPPRLREVDLSYAQYSESRKDRETNTGENQLLLGMRCIVGRETPVGLVR